MTQRYVLLKDRYNDNVITSYHSRTPLFYISWAHCAYVQDGPSKQHRVLVVFLICYRCMTVTINWLICHILQIKFLQSYFSHKWRYANYSCHITIMSILWDIIHLHVFLLCPGPVTQDRGTDREWLSQGALLPQWHCCHRYCWSSWRAGTVDCNLANCLVTKLSVIYAYQYEFKMLEAQLLLFSRLCEVGTEQQSSVAKVCNQYNAGQQWEGDPRADVWAGQS